ncbi:MAG: sensor histidine kinase [Spirochaetia bacterium]
MKRISLQQKIGIVAATGCFFVAFFYFWTVYTTETFYIFRVITSLKVGAPIMVGVCFLLTATRESPIYRAVQVSLFFSLSPLPFLTLDYMFYGPVLMVMGYVTAFKYGYLEKYFYSKTSFIFLAALLATIIPPFLLFKRDLTDQMGILTSAGILLVFLWVLYENAEIERLKKEAKLKQENNRNRKMGRIATNVGGLVHNLKNDISLITANLYMLQEEGGYQNQLHGIQHAVDRLNSRINRILLAIKADTLKERTAVDLELLICSIVEGFQVERDFKKGLEVEINVEKNLTLFSSISELSQIIENLISNAWDAVKSTGSRGKLTINGVIREDRTILTFKDTGRGIEGFEHSVPVSCMKNDFFKVGKTTKEEGSGFGMVYVIETMRKYNGDVRISSQSGRGTAVILVFENTQQPY